MNKCKQIQILLVMQLFLSSVICCNSALSQGAMINIAGRDIISLNGEWQVIIDPVDVGTWREVWKEKKPQLKTDFVEYSFEGGPKLNVPGDFNSQMPELTYYEGIVWYKKTFGYSGKENKRLFLHFAAVNYLADVYLNGKLLGSHEGGFTPFQFEITDKVLEGENRIVVKVDNRRLKDGIPGLGYDWFNYGGITRDVNLVETPSTFIEDYSIQLVKSSLNEVSGWIKLNGDPFSQSIRLIIPELKIDLSTVTNREGIARILFSENFELWNPGNPKLYKIRVECETDTITDHIGFRNIEVKGSDIYLNGDPVFLKGVNIHEEIPLRASRAFSESDALVLLGWAKELGCNLVRLAHYPHSEYMVKLAEKMGLLVWEELPVYQHIEFSTPGVEKKMHTMLGEMVNRDRNRCAVVVWSLSNETYSFTTGRDSALIKIAKQCRNIDSTRLIASVFCNQVYENNTITVWDTLCRYFDIISLNEYLGWYVPWQSEPEHTKWELVCDDKPVFISEFGGEALYGNHQGPPDEAAYWNEEYQEKIYTDQITLFRNVPNLSGVCPWILADFRSPGRMHPVYQNGWNRKGLLSDRGEKKRAWYVMKHYYETIGNGH